MVIELPPGHGVCECGCAVYELDCTPAFAMAYQALCAGAISFRLNEPNGLGECRHRVTLRDDKLRRCIACGHTSYVWYASDGYNVPHKVAFEADYLPHEW